MLQYQESDTMFDWFWSRVFSSERLEYLLKKAQPQVELMLTEAMNDYLSSEEFGVYILGVTDAIYERYSKKFFGSIGGAMRGVNAAIDKEVAEANPLVGIFTKWQKTGKLDAKALIGAFIMGQIRKQPVLGSRFKKKLSEAF